MAAAWLSTAIGRAGPAPATKPAAPTMVLNLPDNVEVKILVDYVSRRLGMNILYDQKIAGKRITLRSPTAIPRDSMLDLLQSILMANNLRLADDKHPGWKTIVTAGDPKTISKRILSPADPLPAVGPLEPITQVVNCRHVTPAALAVVLKPFLTQPGGNTMAIAGQPLLIVSDYRHNFQRLLRMIELADRPGPPTAVKFVRVKHAEPARLAQEVLRLLGEKYRHSSGAGRQAPPLPSLQAMARTGELVVIGRQQAVADALELIAALDVPLDVVTRMHQFDAADPALIERLAKELVDPQIIKSRYRSSIDKAMRVLVVTAPPAVHEKIEALKESLDVAARVRKSPVRFYKLINTTAADVLATIRSLQSGRAGLASIALPDSPGASALGVMPPPAGADLPPGPDPGKPPAPPAYRAGKKVAAAAGPLKPARTTVRTADAVVTADANTNSIIVIAPPATQQIYEQLIRMLDKRRPQVLVEVTMVTLDTSEGFSLGVDILWDHASGDKRQLTFSAFGLSTVDVASGALVMEPGVGFNGTVIDPDLVDIVIRALKTNGRAKVVSAPRILVNDNAEGTLASIVESPFTSINASDTVATTSFAGYASAGSTISIKPHISEGDHILLTYDVTLNSFTGEGGEGVPPPRQTNTLSSEATIPDGHAIIVGGLTRQDTSTTVSRIPWLGEIPYLEHLFSRRSENTSQSTLFVFIRPIILRDDAFADLKYLSERDLAKAKLRGTYPANEPMLMD